MKQNVLLTATLDVSVSSRLFYSSADTIVQITYKVTPLMQGEPED